MATLRYAFGGRSSAAFSLASFPPKTRSVNVFGGSYGTKAALVYLRRHGDHVRTVALEAVASPQFLIPLPFAKGLQSSVDGVIALCAADAGAGV